MLGCDVNSRTKRWRCRVCVPAVCGAKLGWDNAAGFKQTVERLGRHKKSLDRRQKEAFQYMTLRFHKSRFYWQHIIWLRQILLFLITATLDVTIFALPSENTDPGAYFSNIAIHIFLAVLLQSVFFAWHWRRRPYVFIFQVSRRGAPPQTWRTTAAPCGRNELTRTCRTEGARRRSIA